MNTINDYINLFNLLPKANLNNFIFNIIVGSIIYILVVWIIIYLSNKYEAYHIRKPIIATYTILSLFFISVFKFIILSLAFIGITYIMCLYL